MQYIYDTNSKFKTKIKKHNKLVALHRMLYNLTPPMLYPRNAPSETIPGAVVCQSGVTITRRG